MCGGGSGGCSWRFLTRLLEVHGAKLGRVRIEFAGGGREGVGFRFRGGGWDRTFERTVRLRIWFWTSRLDGSRRNTAWKSVEMD